jgi:diguanylate cyclase (GGDEF)-like protein
MFRRSFKGKIIFPVVVVLAVLTTVLTIYVSLKFLHHSNVLIDEKTATDAQALRLHIEHGQTRSKAAAMSMARNWEALHAIRNRDRELILRIFKPMCEVYQVDYFTITDENGIVLVRTYEFEQAGESILNQQNVQDARNGHVATHLETGTRVKVAVRTGAPVYDTDETLIGIISAGIRYDTDEAVDLMKKHFHSDVSIFLGETKIATTVLDGKKQRIMETTLDTNVEKVIKEKTEHSGDADTLGVTYRTFYMPIIDAKGEVFAVFSVGYPLAEREAAAKALVRNIIIISLIGLAVSVAILYWVISTISKPILDLSKEMNRMEGGSLILVTDPKSDDEIGLATKSLQKVASILQKLISDINTAISEHEKGNMEYRIDISDFNGAYRLLVERIITLSSLGMEDQLTGLPNRRSFDNRLEMEWVRAMRENVSLSVLMIDVDQFKTYNDTYGHQQGDVALQAVAKTVSLPIKRGTDFAARWGGEEFVVLLPHTNTEGASYVAERIRSQVENRDIPSLDGGPVKKVTVSIGVSALIPTPNTSIEILIAHADTALYQAKKTGRNRVCQYEENT